MIESSRRAPVASCHSAAAGPLAAAGAPVVALVGAPNVGKTTLFNCLTGARRDTGNWPGTSVAVGHGSWRPGGDEVAVVDLPGTYSLDPLSPDEALTRALLVEVPEPERPDVVVVVLDATALARSLYLLAQVRELPGRVIAVVTMTDVAAARGLRVDAARLAAAVGAPVVEVDPRRGTGTDRLAQEVRRSLSAPPPPALAPALPAAPDPAPAPGAHPDPRAAPGTDLRPDLDRHLHPGPDPDPEARLDAELDAELDPELALADARFAWIDAAVEAGQQRERAVQLTRSDRIDRIVTSPVGGAVVFLAAMWLLFQVTTWVAAPLQRALGGLLTGPVAAGARTVLTAVGLDRTAASGFVVQGLLPGVGMVLTFVPLLGLMFGLLAVLEDSGYLARAAVVTDRMMRVLRLPGRAFLPLVVGFGCNVPGVSGTRVLADARHRRLTTLLVPFTSCSGRLTVYVLVAEVFFPEHAGSVVFAMYVISVLFVVLAGLVLRSTVLRDLPDEPLMIDLPAYHLPVPRLVLRAGWTRLRAFLSTAGGLIVGTVALVWLLQAIPASGDGGFGQVPVERSVYASAARVISPVFGPTGFGDWHTTSALVTGFVAKEAVISTWSQTYAGRPSGTPTGPSGSGPTTASGSSGPGGTGRVNGSGPATTSSGAAGTGALSSQALGTAVREHFTASSGGHPGAAAWAFLVFLLAYTPCVATLAAQRREIGLRWTAIGVLNQLATAWLAAVLVFQVGRLIG